MPYRWKLVAMLFCCGALNYADRAATAAVFPLLRSSLGITDLQIAAVGSLFLWSYAIGSPLAGAFADRISRSRLIVCSLAAWSIVTACTSLVTSVNQLLFTRVLLGMAECVYLPAAIALIADHHGAKSRASAIGIHTAGLSAGLVGGGTLSGYLGEHFGWQVPFLTLGSAGLLLALIGFFVLRDGAEPRPAVSAPQTRGLHLELFRIRSFAIMLLAAMFSAAGNNIFTNWLPLYFRETYGLSLAHAGFSGTFLVQFSGVIGAVSGGFVSDRVASAGRHRRMLLQSIASVFAAPALILFLWRPPLATIALCIFLFGLMRSAAVANESPLLCDLLEPRKRSSGVGFLNAANCLAGGLGIFAAGLLKGSHGLDSAFAGISALMLGAAAVTMTGFLFFLRRDLEKVEPSASQGI